MPRIDQSYHGVNFWDAFGNHPKAVAPGLAFVLKVRTGLLRDIGACLSPFNSWLILQGVETLPLRARAHCANALKVAEYLSKHPLVSWVNFPGLPSHPDYQRAKKYMPMGPGAVMGFGIKGGLEAGKKFINSVKLASHLANILDAKTLVIHPASTTHQQLSPEQQQSAGVTPDFIRVSIGIEDVNDIIADLDHSHPFSASMRICSMYQRVVLRRASSRGVHRNSGSRPRSLSTSRHLERTPT